ncbi:MAG: transcription termination/antitermination protein NusG [Thermoguttaceae bacterium]
MASDEPAAAVPPEAMAGRVEAPQAQPPEAAVPEEQTPSSVHEPVAAQPEGQTQPAEPLAPAPAAETAAAELPPEEVKEATEAKAEEKVEKKAEAPPKEKPQEKAEEKPEEKSDKMDWYILKVQSNREESIREGLLRRVAIAGLGFFFDQVIVPTEKVTEFKGGKKKVIKRKLYPGYLVVHMEINDDTWFLVRETPGIGDFTGAAGRPSPMLPHEVARIVAKQEEKSEKAPKLKIAFREGERVKIKEGTFENFEGDVDSIDETNGRVTVMINIFGRSTPVELEYWQIETL